MRGDVRPSRARRPSGPRRPGGDAACGASRRGPPRGRRLAGRRPRRGRRSSLLLDQLDEGAEGALGVDEGHGGAAAARAGGLVDGVAPGGHHGLERRRRSRRPGSRRGGGPRPASRGTWRRASRGWCAGAAGCSSSATLSSASSTPSDSTISRWCTSAPKVSRVVRDGRLEVVDGDGDVVDLGEQHAGDARPPPHRLPPGPGSGSGGASGAVAAEEGDLVLADLARGTRGRRCRGPPRAPGTARRSCPRAGCGGPA